jgi:hypothetical protein
VGEFVCEAWRRDTPGFSLCDSCSFAELLLIFCPAEMSGNCRAHESPKPSRNVSVRIKSLGSNDRVSELIQVRRRLIHKLRVHVWRQAETERYT